MTQFVPGHDPRSRRTWMACPHPTIKKGFFQMPAPGFSGWAAEGHSSSMLQRPRAQAGDGAGSSDGNKIPVPALWDRVLQQQDWRLPWAGTGFSLFKCNLQVCSLRESHPKITSSCCFVHNYLHFFFLAICRAFSKLGEAQRNKFPALR